MPLNKKISSYQENITIFDSFGFIFMDLFAIQVVLLNNLVHIYCSRLFIKKNMNMPLNTNNPQMNYKLCN